MVIKTCSNGHNYDTSQFSTCPYCPKGNSGTFRTEVFEERSDSNNSGDSAKTRIVHPQGSPINATKIVVPGFEVENKKLVGFLVTYALNPLGDFFKLYEGRNSLGSDPSCSIVISNDIKISGKHLTILYRGGKFKFKDEFSTNATFVNEVEVDEGFLQNQDVLRIGKTKFVFLAIPFELFK